MRINKYIASSGQLSRRKADDAILNSRVKVNGIILTEPGYNVQTGDIISLDDKVITPIDKNKYYAFNKPVNVLSSHQDPYHDSFIYDFLPSNEGLFSVGRLDFTSEGLLIITNDGELANYISHPSNFILKEYVVQLSRNPSKKEMQSLLSGVTYKREKYVADDITRLSSDEISKVEKWIEKPFDSNFSALYRVVLHEGKKREIRNMFSSLNIDVIRLIRTKINNLELVNLKPGEFRNLTIKEIESLTDEFRE